MIHPWRDLPPGRHPPEEVTAVIEIPSGSRNKYEYDHVRHRFVLDRTLYSSVHYPCDYGFIEGSLADDGDPLDVLIVIAEPTFPGCVVRARPIGVLDMKDDKGHDYKILAVAHDDPRWEREERGTAYLRSGANTWLYLPSAEKVVRVGAKQNFGGGDFSNADIFRLSRHREALLNAAALRAVGYTQDTPNPPGGEG